MKRLLFLCIAMIAICLPAFSKTDKDCEVDQVFTRAELLTHYDILCGPADTSAVSFTDPVSGIQKTVWKLGEAVDKTLGVPSFFLRPKSNEPYLLMGSVSPFYKEQPIVDSRKSDDKLRYLHKRLYNLEEVPAWEEVSRFLQASTLQPQKGAPCHLLKYAPDIQLDAPYPYPNLLTYKVACKGEVCYLFCFYDGEKINHIEDILSENLLPFLDVKPSTRSAQPKGKLDGIKNFDNHKWKSKSKR